MTAIKVALIGCGRVAGHHLRSIAGLEGGRIVAVCDLVESKAKAYGDEYKIPYFVSYHEMFKTVSDIDVAAIITPSGMHFEHATEIIRRYRKHVLVEKPTFMRPEDVVEAYRLAKATGVHIFPVFQNRHNKAVRRVKHAIESGELGAVRIVAVRVRWCRPQRYYDLAPWRGTLSHDGGAFTNQGIHHIDLLRYLGGDVRRVNCTMRTLGVTIEAEDTGVATMTYSNDAVGVLEITTAARPDDFEASLSIVGEKGLAQLGGWAVNELQIFTPDPSACAAHSEKIPDAYGFGHATVYRQLIAHFREGVLFSVDEADCLRSIKLLHAFYRSDEERNWVEVDASESSRRLGRTNDAISDLYRTREPVGTGL